MNYNEPYRKRGFFHSTVPVLVFYLIQSIVSMLFMAAELMPIARELLEANPSISYDELLSAMLAGSGSNYAMMLLLANVLVLLYGGLLFFRNERRWNDLKYENKVSGKDLGAMAIFGVGLYFLVNVVLTVVLSFAGTGLGESAELLNSTMESVFDSGLLLSIFVVGILAPIAEEVVMRGLVFNRFRDITTPTTAMFISGFLFGMMHLPIVVQMLYTMAVGVIFAYAYRKFENILIPITLHVAYNMTSFLFTIEAVNSFVETIAGSIVFYAIAVIGSLIGFRYLKNKPMPTLKAEYRQAVSRGDEE